MSRWTGPIYWPISLYGDDGWGLRVEFVEPDADGVEQPIDVAARTYAAQVRQVAGGADLLATMTVDMSEAGDGIVTLTIPAEVVRGLVGYWDFQEVIGSAAPTTLLAGDVSWRADVTR